MIGQRIASYEITARLGEGGMGEVYRARDTKLGREVALKILPPAFADDPDRLARFQREARVLASLNHPHIAAIHGLEDAPSTSSGQAVRALVLELVEGPTLAERLERGPLPLAEATAVARQIADALEAAHEQGIVHRDLKPANIKVTPAGTVKVLDFGLAKALQSVTGADEAAAPTATALGTRVGVVLGTPAYMSPEQARGQAVDKRTDIWAFGCVVYELLTGRRAFSGQTVQDTLAAVFEREPDWTRVPGATPAAIRRLLRRCLEKDPKQRLRDIGDARIELKETGGEGAGEPAGPSLSRQPASIARWAIATGVAALGLGFLAGAVWWSLARPVAVIPQDVVRLTVPLPPGEVFSFDAGLPNTIAISPDGEQILYTSRSGSGDRLYLRRRGDLTATPLAGTEGATGPFFSPDGRSIGFASGGALRTMPVSGGTPQVLAPVTNFWGASWGPDDTIIYTPDWQSPLLAVSARGGEPRQLTTMNPEAGDQGHRNVQILPGGTSAVVGLVTTEFVNSMVELVDLDTGHRRALVEGHNPFYLGSGHLAFARGDAIFVAPFDLQTRRLRGAPVQMLAGVQSIGVANFVVSPNGTLAYVPSVAGVRRRLLRVDRDGRSRALAEETAAFVHPRISPDGTRFVVQAAGEFFVYDVLRGTRVRLRAQGSRPIWTPDGRSIVFNAERRLYSAPIDDSAAPALVLEPAQGSLFPLAWSRDGRVLVYSHAVAGTGRDIWMLPSGDEPTPFLTTVRDERAAMFSPDGRWVVYADKDVGREEEVYVQPYPGPGGRAVVSRGGGIEPVWSPTGGEIFYRSVDGRRMIAVEVQTEPSFSAGTPRILFEGRYPLGQSYWSDYDVWPDGQEFLMVAADEVAGPELHVVINWITEVTERLAASQ